MINWSGISRRLTLSSLALRLMSHSTNTALALYCLSLKTRKCFSTHSVFRNSVASCNCCHGKKKKKIAAKVTNLTTCFRQLCPGILFLLVVLMIFPQLKWNENLGEIIFMLYFLYNSSLLPWFSGFNYSGDHIDVNT